MSEKVKVTKDQIHTIEGLRMELDLEKIIGDFMQHSGGYLRAFEDMSIEQFALMLCGYYEVEPGFTKGDWIVPCAFTGQPGNPEKVIALGDSSAKTDGDPSRGLATIRHATPIEIAAEKERRWWARHGRDAWELYEGDVIFNKASNELKEITSYRKIDKSNLINVICFAENRLDRSGSNE